MESDVKATLGALSRTPMLRAWFAAQAFLLGWRAVQEMHWFLVWLPTLLGVGVVVMAYCVIFVLIAADWFDRLMLE